MKFNESVMSKLIVVFLFCCVLFACSKSSVVPKTAPEFKSSIPEDNAVGVKSSTNIEVEFYEDVSLADNHSVTLNSKFVKVKASSTKLIFNSNLNANTTYTINIPAGSVSSIFNVPLVEDIRLTFSTEESKIEEAGVNLVSTNPSPEATNLYSFLKENYGKKIISSAMANVNWNINEAEWVKQHTGKYPAIATFDYVHLPYSPVDWVDYSDISFVEDWWSNNGIISAGWHWIVPTYEGSVDYTYKPEETTFKASNVTIDGTWENTVAKADLEEIVGYLKLLQAKNIPVIWRPLHEAAGNTYEYTNGETWFWWGTDGADTYKELWVFMFDYFKAQGLNNLIWVWTTQTKDNAFYPGDNYVDIVGRDIYNNAEAASIAAEFNTIQQTYPTKMITLSECGNTADISEQWNAGAKWSYFMPWYDYERTNDTNESDFAGNVHEHANVAWWTNAFSNTYVITRDQMPDLK